jgi:3-isopropylmalate/(R)-2-methylmalate dehydratase large subunit
MAQWQGLVTDNGAVFDREETIDADAVAPTVTWGVSPEDALPVTAMLPTCEGLPAARATYVAEALSYMGLRAGQPLAGVPVDRVFIGSCTNARIEDLRAAASVLKGRKAMVPGLVSPGSSGVKRMAEAEGLDQIFITAGFTFADSGCSLCVGMNGDSVASGERCASTTNRNFRGRQGTGARTHLMSPAMAAAAAVTGCITDVRTLPPVES